MCACSNLLELLDAAESDVLNLTRLAKCANEIVTYSSFLHFFHVLSWLVCKVFNDHFRRNQPDEFSLALFRHVDLCLLELIFDFFLNHVLILLGEALSSVLVHDMIDRHEFCSTVPVNDLLPDFVFNFIVLLRVVEDHVGGVLIGTLMARLWVSLAREIFSCNWLSWRFLLAFFLGLVCVPSFISFVKGGIIFPVLIVLCLFLENFFK